MTKFTNNYNEHYTKVETHRDAMPVYTIDNLGFYMMVEASALFPIFIIFFEILPHEAGY